MKQSHKILIGLGVGAGLAYVLHSMYGKKKNGVASAPSLPQAEPTREEKEEFIIETLEPSEPQSGFDGDRFHYDPTLGYELPVGTINETDAGAEMILPREGNLAQEIFFNADGMMGDRSDRTLAHKMRPAEHLKSDIVFAKTKDIALDPTEEAMKIMAQMSDDEVNVAYDVAKTLSINPNMTKAQILEALGFDSSETGVVSQTVMPKLNNISVLKGKPNWNSRWTARRKMIRERIKSKRGGLGSRIGKGVSPEKREKRCDTVCRAKHPFNKGKKRDCVTKCASRESFKDQITNRTDGAMWGGHRQDGRPTIPLPPIPQGLKPKKPVLNNSQKRNACGKKCELMHPFNKGKRNSCKDGCWAKYP